MNKIALQKLSYGLYVVGVGNDEQRSGCVINTALQVTSKPPQLSVTISKDNHTHDALMQTKHCTISILAQDAPMELISNFGFQSSRDVDKFANIAYQKDQNGTPYLDKYTCAWLSGDITATLDVGSHTLFIVTITEGEVTSDQIEPLTYSYYHQIKKGTTPKNAPSFDDTPKSGWRCSVCGYVHESDELPEDFTCPICHQPRSAFIKQ